MKGVFLIKTGYELYQRKIFLIFHFRVFGSKYYILKANDKLDKFDFKSQNEIFLSLSLNIGHCIKYII